MSENNLSIGATDEGFDGEDGPNRPKLSRTTGDDRDESDDETVSQTVPIGSQSQKSEPPSPDRQADASTGTDSRGADRRSPLADAYEFDTRERAVQKEFSPARITPDITTDAELPHKYQRPTPVKSGVVQLSACVRPEVAAAVTDAQRETRDYFDNEDVLELDFHDAVYCVALQHLDEVAAVMAKTGYGLKH